MLQLEHRYDMDITEERYLQIIYQKTASLIENSCRIGVSFNERMAAARRGLRRLRQQDRPGLPDHRRHLRLSGRRTAPGQAHRSGLGGRPHHPAADRRLAQRHAASGETVSPNWPAATDSAARAACWPEVKSFVTDFGGVDYAFAKAREFGEEAKGALAPVASGPQKDLLAVAVEYVINRLN